MKLSENKSTRKWKINESIKYVYRSGGLIRVTGVNGQVVRGYSHCHNYLNACGQSDLGTYSSPGWVSETASEFGNGSRKHESFLNDGGVKRPVCWKTCSLGGMRVDVGRIIREGICVGRSALAVSDITDVTTSHSWGKGDTAYDKTSVINDLVKKGKITRNQGFYRRWRKR